MRNLGFAVLLALMAVPLFLGGCSGGQVSEKEAESFGRPSEDEKKAEAATAGTTGGQEDR